MVGTGVASFSHVGGVHYQNADGWEQYVEGLENGELPIARALPITSEQQLIREFVLQLKLGRVDTRYFKSKFAVDLNDAFGEAFETLTAQGYLKIEGDEVVLTRPGLLRVDALLPHFFEKQYRNVRYT